VSLLFKDRILAGTIAGMIASLIKDIPNLLLWKLGIVKFTYFALASSALVSAKDSTTISGWVIGIMVDIITGGALGLTIYLLV
jgi:cell shape-determining protein MreD